MKRPPRDYRPPQWTCVVCGQPARPSPFGGFEHARRQPIKGGHLVTDVRGRLVDA